LLSVQYAKVRNNYESCIVLNSPFCKNRVFFFISAHNQAIFDAIFVIVERLSVSKMGAAGICICLRLHFSVGKLIKSLPQQSSFCSDPARPHGTDGAPRL
jgi:hypothetical protein